MCVTINYDVCCTLPNNNIHSVYCLRRQFLILNNIHSSFVLSMSVLFVHVACLEIGVTTIPERNLNVHQEG